MRRADVGADSSAVSRRFALGAIAAGVAWLQGCGGGGGTDGGVGGGANVAGLTSGGTGSFTTGTVSGLGSIIVRGVRFDDSRAVVSRADEGVVGSIRPGMVVAIEASAVTPAQPGATLASATALRISYASEWVGRIEAVDTAVGTVTVLGQTIEVPPAAVIEGAATQLSALTAGQFVEVHGYLDLSTARLLATLVEVSAGAPSAFRLSGRVASLDTAARTFRIGTALIGYDAAVAPPAGFADGMLVRVVLGTTQVAGTWPARGIRVREVLAGVEVGEQDEGEVEGTVTALGPGTSFSVNGVPVDASGLAAVAGLVLGALVKAKGTMRGGVLVATQVEVRPRGLPQPEDFVFIGPVSGLNILTRTFTVQDRLFTYGLTTPIHVLNWLTGATPTVEVHAVLVNGQWQATEIREAS